MAHVCEEGALGAVRLIGRSASVFELAHGLAETLLHLIERPNELAELILERILHRLGVITIAYRARVGLNSRQRD